MKVKMYITKENGNIDEVEKDFTVKDIKTANNGILPEEDKAGEYLYIVNYRANHANLPYYYYKMSDKCTVPCSTGISLETVIE